MYPPLHPQLELEETINHPLEPTEVYGFKGRNKVLGRPAVVLKETAISRAGVQVPGRIFDYITDTGAELVVLDRDEVMTMEASDFEAETTLNTIRRDGESATVHTVDPTSPRFVYWSRSSVEVGN